MSLRSVLSLVEKSFVVAALVTFGLSLATGQQTTGRIVGTVTDSTGAVVPGAKLTATSPTAPSGLAAPTDGHGRFTFESAPIGVYTITTTKAGFATLTGGGPGIMEAATNITARQFDDLPKGRSFNTLLQIAPGVRQETKNGNSGVAGYQVDGASGSENSFVLDGVDVSDIRRGSLRLQNAIPVEFVQEIEVKSSGFEAQYGGAAGGVINVATRAGTNSFHGQIGGDFTNSQINPRPRGYWQRSATNANAAEFFAPKEDVSRTFYPGGVFSGPILADKVYFTAGLFPTYNRLERYVEYPSGTRAFNQENINYYSLSRLDFSPNSKLQVNSSWMWSPQRRKGTLPNVDPRVAAPSNDLTVQGGWQPSQAYTASVNYSITPSFLMSARYGYKYQNAKDGNYGLSGAPFITYQNPAPAGVPLPGVAGFRNVSSTFGVVRDVTSRNNIYLDASFLRNIAGQAHTFKFGYSVARVSNDVLSDFTNGQFNIFWGDSFTRGSITGAKGTYGYYIWEDGVRQNASVNSRNQGFYFQDSWRVHSRVTLNLGLRLEDEFLPPYRKEQNGIKVANPVSFGWTDKIA
ncbi:MAG: TonB-dependent receptor, partial [Candidatus Solibacter sp.]|nr:TonB-dependent receptor [Candidatus Solibacter sp.]